MFGEIANFGSNVLQYVNELSNRDEQRRVNEQMRHDSQNAYTYAVADRMRAGLSPIDTSPSETPALGSYAVESPDYSGIGSSVDNALRFHLEAKEANSRVDVNNATAANTRADTLNKAQELKYQQRTLEDRIDLVRENLKQSRFLSDTQRERYESELKNLEQERDNLVASYNEIIHSTGRQDALAAVSGAKGLSEMNLNNAREVESRASTNRIVAETRTKLWDLARSQNWNLRTTDGRNQIWNSISSVLSGGIHAQTDLVDALKTDVFRITSDNHSTINDVINFVTGFLNSVSDIL